MAAYEAIMFDFDGVLVDSEPVHFACWREILAPLAVNLDWETYLGRCRGKSDKDLLEVLCSLSDPPLDLNQLFELYPRKKERFRLAILEGKPITEEVCNLLGSLEGYRLALVSSNCRAEIELRLPLPESRTTSTPLYAARMHHARSPLPIPTAGPRNCWVYPRRWWLKTPPSVQPVGGRRALMLWSCPPSTRCPPWFVEL